MKNKSEEDKELLKTVNKVYNIFGSWTDLGVEDSDIEFLKSDVKKVLKRFAKKIRESKDNVED